MDNHNLLEKIGIYTPPINAINIANYFGILVSFCDFGEKYQNIYSFNDGEEIYINKNIHPYKMNFSIAREFSHIKLNGKKFFESNEYKPNQGIIELLTENTNEVNVNKFALNLIAPPNMLKKYFKYSSKKSMEILFMLDFYLIQYQLNSKQLV